MFNQDITRHKVKTHRSKGKKGGMNGVVEGSDAEGEEVEEEGLATDEEEKSSMKEQVGGD